MRMVCTLWPSIWICLYMYWFIYKICTMFHSNTTSYTCSQNNCNFFLWDTLYSSRDFMQRYVYFWDKDSLDRDCWVRIFISHFELLLGRKDCIEFVKPYENSTNRKCKSPICISLCALSGHTNDIVAWCLLRTCLYTAQQITHCSHGQLYLLRLTYLNYSSFFN